MTGAANFILDENDPTTKDILRTKGIYCHIEVATQRGKPKPKLIL
jgi:hypothetical protein